MASSGYTYEVSLRLVRGRDGHAPGKPASVTFEHINHDDIIAIVERMRSNSGLAPEAAAAVAVGTKLLGEVMTKGKTQSTLQSAESRALWVHRCIEEHCNDRAD